MFSKVHCLEASFDFLFVDVILMSIQTREPFSSGLVWIPKTQRSKSLFHSWSSKIKCHSHSHETRWFVQAFNIAICCVNTKPASISTTNSLHVISMHSGLTDMLRILLHKTMAHCVALRLSLSIQYDKVCYSGPGGGGKRWRASGVTEMPQLLLARRDRNIPYLFVG